MQSLVLLQKVFGCECLLAIFALEYLCVLLVLFGVAVKRVLGRRNEVRWGRRRVGWRALRLLSVALDAIRVVERQHLGSPRALLELLVLQIIDDVNRLLVLVVKAEMRESNVDPQGT